MVDAIYLSPLILTMRFIVVLLLITGSIAVSSQSNNRKVQVTAAPKLVVGIVIDQMRWDYLYRYGARFGNGGFKRMIKEGFSADNTYIPYIPTVTAAGHTCIYTGSVPNIHGITGNNWFESKLNKTIYCTDDDTVRSIGSSSNAGKMSPRNLFASTMCDELRLATNFRGKVIAIALKDRGAILPAGHSANAAYWYDDANASFITSSYYMNSLPEWVNNFNRRKLPDSLVSLGWETLYPIETYVQSTGDEKWYEGKYSTSRANTFPYTFPVTTTGANAAIRLIPGGNTLTAAFAKAAIVNEGLGKDAITDFLAVSFSSTDYIGHQFGPNSIENEDDYLRLDKELESFFNFLDTQVGQGAYIAFLSADHAVSHVPGFLTEHKLPGGLFNSDSLKRDMNLKLRASTGHDSLVYGILNYQVHLNHSQLKKYNLEEDQLRQWVADYMLQQPQVSQAFDIRLTMLRPINETLRTRVANGYYNGRSGDVQIILKPGFMDHGTTGTTHSSWNPYDSHIPLLLMGWGIKHGSTRRETYMTDIAATITALLYIQMPNGCVGKVIEEALQ